MRKNTRNKPKQKSIMRCFSILFAILGISLSMGMALPVERSLPEILAELARYQPGQNDDILLDLRQQVQTKMSSALNRPKCEDQLLGFLEGPATAEGKLEVCRFLRIFGSEKTVSVMGRLLLKEKDSDMARYVLERIPLESADSVLLKGLGQTQGNLKIGVITSLGQRKVTAATPELGRLVQGSEEYAIAAAASLGQIANTQAIQALAQALNSTSGELQIRVASSLLMCAEAQISLGEKHVAHEIYQSVFSAPLDLNLRQAALRGKLRASGDHARDEIVTLLKGQDEKMYTTAIALAHEFFSASDISALCDIFPQLPARYKVQMLGVLSEYQTPATLGAALDAVKDADTAVRIAALNALGYLGDAGAVPLLIQQAARTSGAEKEAARSSLWALKGEEVNEAILSNLPRTSDPEQHQELIRSIGQRRIIAGKEILLDTIQTEDAPNRVEAIRALKWLAAPADLSRMLDVLLALPDSREQDEMALAVALAAGRIPREDYRGDAVEKRLEELEDISGRSILYRVLGKIGDDSTLPALRKAMAESDKTIFDSAVRAFAEWPTPYAKDDVFQIAATSTNPTYKVLALQAYIRMVSLEEYRMPEAVVTSFKTALALGIRTQEKIAILSLLPRFACEQGLKLAETLAQENDVQDEAQIAIEKIKERLEEAQKF